MPMTKAEKWRKVHAEAIRKFNDTQSALRNERLQCLQDRRFYSIAGAQWEGNLGLQFENKAKFEVNKIHLAVMRAISEYRNNRITVNFVSRDGAEDESFADTCDGLYRADEQASGAEEAYDNAFEEAVSGGFGAFRLRTELEDEYDDESDYQRIRIEPINDADSCVFFDLNAKRMDKSDAKHCWVLVGMTPDGYKELYGDPQDYEGEATITGGSQSTGPNSVQKVVHQHEFDWLTPMITYVAEYYCVEEVKVGTTIWRGLAGEEEEYTAAELREDPGLERELASRGFTKVDEVKRRQRRVHKYVMDGRRILTDEGHIAGCHIPIVPVYGKRWFIDNVERCSGIVRTAKDAQRIKNMQLSKLGEISAISSVQKMILTPEQIIDHQDMWTEDNIKNYPYLLINSTMDKDGNSSFPSQIPTTIPPAIPPALGALIQMTDQDLEQMLGAQGSAEEVQSNVSGKAYELVQNRKDMQTYIYLSNFSKAIRRAGEIWLSMAKDVYTDQGRKMKTLGSDGQSAMVQLKKPVMVKGEQKTANDFEEATFDVGVDVGPTSQTKRQQLTREFTGMMQFVQDPQTLQVIQLMALRNMEGEGLSDFQEWIRKQLVQMNVLKPSDEEAKQQQAAAAQKAQQPDPTALALQAQAQQLQAQASLQHVQVIKTMADAQKANADTEKVKAEALEILHGMDLASKQQMIDLAMQLKNDIEKQQTTNGGTNAGSSSVPAQAQ